MSTDLEELVRCISRFSGHLRELVPATDQWEVRVEDLRDPETETRPVQVVMVRFRRRVGERVLAGMQMLSPLLLTDAIALDAVAEHVAKQWAHQARTAEDIVA